KDGVEFPIEVSVSTTQIGGRRHLIAIVRDITDRRRAQEFVGETLAIYKLMCDGQKDAIILVDMETERFLEVNKAATEIYGYSKEDFLKMRIIDVFADMEAAPDKAAQSKAAITIFRHKRKDGTLFPAEITGCALIWKKRKTFCAIVRDISGRELLEHYGDG
ncbi:MAG: PAS domain S-box protein, partial [Pseudomonadota bacterium]